MPATLDHFEIPAADSDRLATFLKAVFGWPADEPVDEPVDGEGDGGRALKAPVRYRRLVPGSGNAGAALRQVRVGLFEGSADVLDRPVPVVRLTGETLEVCLERVSSAGGTVLLPPETVGVAGRFARFADPENNQWGLWEPAESGATGS